MGPFVLYLGPSTREVPTGVVPVLSAHSSFAQSGYSKTTTKVIEVDADQR